MDVDAFPYEDADVGGETEYTMSISLADVELKCDNNDQYMMVVDKLSTGLYGLLIRNR